MTEVTVFLQNYPPTPDFPMRLSRFICCIWNKKEAFVLLLFSIIKQLLEILANLLQVTSDLPVDPE